MKLDADSDDPAHAPFSYDYREHSAAQQLDVLFSVGLVRLEFYRLDGDGTLRHLWNFGFPLPPMNEVRAHREAWVGTVKDRLDVIATPTELLQMMDLRQRSLFESTLPAFDVRAGAPQVVAAWDRQLQVLDDAARSHATGRIVDERMLEEAASALRQAEMTVQRHLIEPDENSVRPGEALMQLSVKEDTRWFSCAVVHRTPDGCLRGAVQPLDTVDNASLTAADSWSDRLYLLLEPLRDLLGDGVEHLVISAGLGTYSLPVHEAALRLGFRTVTYSHSLRQMHRPPSAFAGGPALVLGHPGEGGQYIAAADAELSVVASLIGGTRVTTGWRTVWPRTVHIAGHGIAGGREHEAGILLADEDFLSGPGILRDVNAEGTEVAFLSACSSGTGRFELGRAAHAVPLDVALIEKGCRTVISTSAPVNDHVALVFAVAFHHARDLGATVWDSYVAARACFRNGQPDAPSEVRKILNDAYPSWQRPLPAAAQDDWMLFRFSGDR